VIGMRRQHLLPVSLLFATACFAPEDHKHDLPPLSGSESGDPEETSGGSQPHETTDVDPQESGDETESESGNDTEPSSDTEEDPTTGADGMAPSVVDHSPANAATGVHGDASIVLTFSEPMDRASTEAAWQSPDIGDVTMSWNDDDTVLTIVPDDRLDYAMGDDVDALPAIEYAFTLDTSATDKAGNALAQELAASFSTLRRIELALPPVDALTGMTYAGGSINISNVYAGDTQSDQQQKGVLSFGLRSLPEGAELVRVDIHADQTTCGGDPYGPLPSLGEVHVMDVEFATNWDAWEAAGVSDLGVLSDNATLETKSVEVTDAVVADYDAGLDTTQFRLEFPVATNGDLVLDRCTFDKPSVGMSLAYLIE
jgi:hypothetical protein